MPTDGHPHEARKRKVSVLVFVGAWAVLGVVAWWMVGRGMGPWVELFNGATWPPLFIVDKANPTPPYDFCFYAILSLRALLNLGVLFTAFTVAYLLYTGSVPEAIMTKLFSVFRTNNVLLTEKLLQMLEDHKIEVSNEVEDELLKAAREFGTSEKDAFLRSRIKEAA